MSEETVALALGTAVRAAKRWGLTYEQTCEMLSFAWREIDLQPKDMVCSSCDADVDPVNPAWRYNGVWQHKCPHLHPQCGYFDAVPRTAPVAATEERNEHA